MRVCVLLAVECADCAAQGESGVHAAIMVSRLRLLPQMTLLMRHTSQMDSDVKPSKIPSHPLRRLHQPLAVDVTDQRLACPPP